MIVETLGFGVLVALVCFVQEIDEVGTLKVTAAATLAYQVTRMFWLIHG